mmetsp:Transcript_8712/g.21470  ORF Transcript_8712/g.21470 Transcript_8712/m.21470 type:complete len:378 (-) Transcript_8712:24-1157(-)
MAVAVVATAALKPPVSPLCLLTPSSSSSIGPCSWPSPFLVLLLLLLHHLLIVLIPVRHAQQHRMDHQPPEEVLPVLQARRLVEEGVEEEGLQEVQGVAGHDPERGDGARHPGPPAALAAPPPPRLRLLQPALGVGPADDVQEEVLPPELPEQQRAVVVVAEQHGELLDDGLGRFHVRVAGEAEDRGEARRLEDALAPVERHRQALGGPFPFDPVEEVLPGVPAPEEHDRDEGGVVAELEDAVVPQPDDVGDPRDEPLDVELEPGLVEVEDERQGAAPDRRVGRVEDVDHQAGHDLGLGLVVRLPGVVELRHRLRVLHLELPHSQHHLLRLALHQPEEHPEHLHALEVVVGALEDREHSVEVTRPHHVRLEPLGEELE